MKRYLMSVVQIIFTTTLFLAQVVPVPYVKLLAVTAFSSMLVSCGGGGGGGDRAPASTGGSPAEPQEAFAAPVSIAWSHPNDSPFVSSDLSSPTIKAQSDISFENSIVMTYDIVSVEGNVYTLNINPFRNPNNPYFFEEDASFPYFAHWVDEDRSPLFNIRVPRQAVLTIAGDGTVSIDSPIVAQVTDRIFYSRIENTNLYIHDDARDFMDTPSDMDFASVWQSTVAIAPRGLLQVLNNIDSIGRRNVFYDKDALDRQAVDDVRAAAVIRTTENRTSLFLEGEGVFYAGDSLTMEDILYQNTRMYEAEILTTTQQDTLSGIFNTHLTRARLVMDVLEIGSLQDESAFLAYAVLAKDEVVVGEEDVYMNIASLQTPDFTDIKDFMIELDLYDARPTQDIVRVLIEDSDSHAQLIIDTLLSRLRPSVPSGVEVSNPNEVFFPLDANIDYMPTESVDGFYDYLGLSFDIVNLSLGVFAPDSNDDTYFRNNPHIFPTYPLVITSGGNGINMCTEDAYTFGTMHGLLYFDLLDFYGCTAEDVASDDLNACPDLARILELEHACDMRVANVLRTTSRGENWIIVGGNDSRGAGAPNTPGNTPGPVLRDRWIATYYSYYYEDEGIDSQIQGTSFGTPYVVRLAAEIKRRAPHYTNDEIAQLIFTTADDIGDPGVDNVFGHGLLNVKAALDELSNRGF